MTNNTDGPSNVESPQTKERLATLEATIKYHTNSLEEISNTLKEVVKIQSMLANQREEILQMTKSLDWVTEAAYRQDKELSNERIKIDAIRSRLNIAMQENAELSNQVITNSRIIKIFSVIASLIIAPIVVAIVISLVP